MGCRAKSGPQARPDNDQGRRVRRTERIVSGYFRRRRTTPRLDPGANQTITLINDDGQAPEVSIADITPVTEGDAGTKILTVTLNVSPTPQQPVSVEINTVDGLAVASTQDTTGDYIPLVKQSVTINGASKDVPITINGDKAQEPNENFHVNISKPINATMGAASKDATILKAPHHPHNLARRSYTHVGEATLIDAAPKFSATPGRAGELTAIGADTEALLADLGYDDLSDLRASGTIA